jgi:hypothetical protein
MRQWLVAIALVGCHDGSTRERAAPATPVAAAPAQATPPPAADEPDADDNDEELGFVKPSKPEKVKKLGIRRDATKLYNVFDGDVYAMPRGGNDNVLVISTDRGDYTLVKKSGVVPEPGYMYFLDPDGDLSRMRH